MGCGGCGETLQMTPKTLMEGTEGLCCCVDVQTQRYDEVMGRCPGDRRHQEGDLCLDDHRGTVVKCSGLHTHNQTRSEDSVHDKIHDRW